jgi:hypothetical protein
MCDLGMFGQVVRVAFGLPPGLGSGANKSAIMQATSERHAAESLSAYEVAELVNNLTINTEHLTRKADECMQKIALIVEGGRTSDAVTAVVRLVREKRGFQIKIRNNRTRISNLEDTHGKLADSALNAQYASVMNRAGYQLKKQNPDAAVDRIEETMFNLKEGMENADKISNALNEDIQTANADDEQSILDEVKRLFDDAEKRKMGAVLASAGSVPMGSVPIYVPAAAASPSITSLPVIQPGRPMALAHSAAPMPAVVKQTPQGGGGGGVPSVPRPKQSVNAMNDFTDV